MVQAIENWAEVEGRLLAVEEHPQHPGQHVATVDVTGVRDVPGFPNMLSWAEGQKLEITIQRAPAGGLLPPPGTVVRWRVRKAGPDVNVLAHDQPL